MEENKKYKFGIDYELPWSRGLLINFIPAGVIHSSMILDKCKRTSFTLGWLGFQIRFLYFKFKE